MPEFETIAHALRAAAIDRPDALAYSADGAPITNGALFADADHLARRLTPLLGEPAERCALLLPTGLDFIRAAYAVHLAGAAPVAVNPDLPPEAVWRRLRLVRPALVLGDAETLGALGQPPDSGFSGRLLTMTALSRLERSGTIAWPAPSDPAFLQFTSGTTGESRAVVVSHRSLLASLEATIRRIGMGPQDILATWVPLHYCLGLVRYVFGAMLAGCPSHLIRPSIVHLTHWLGLVSRVRATITGAPDSAYRLAIHTVDPTKVDLRSLRFAGDGGEVVKQATIEVFERRFGLTGVVRPAYGLAEATLSVASMAPGESLRVDEDGTVSCGRILEAFEATVADEQGRPLPPGSAGELLLRGLPVFDGYFDDEAASRETLRGGWLHTGDLATLDEDGYLFLKGRLRALIKRGGVMVAPREVEDAVDRVPDVCGSAAFGIPGGAGSGTEGVAVVAELSDPAVSAGRASAIVARIGAEIRQSLGWVPSRIVLARANAIPRTAAGKVRYDELRRLMLANALPGQLDGTRGDAR